MVNEKEACAREAAQEFLSLIGIRLSQDNIMVSARSYLDIQMA